MRNRGIELCILPDATSSAGPADGADMNEKAQFAIETWHTEREDDSTVVGATGVPGKQLPSAMAAAHADLAQRCQTVHR